MNPTTDEWGGILVAEEPERDEFGGVLVKDETPAAATVKPGASPISDEFGGVLVEDPQNSPEPGKAPEADFLPSAKAAAAQATLNTVAAIADLAPEGVAVGEKPFRPEDQERWNRLVAERNDIENVEAHQTEGGGGYPNPRLLQIAHELRALSRPPVSETAAGKLRDAAGQAFEYYEADPNAKNPRAQIGRGVGSFGATVPTIVLSLPVAAAQMAGSAYESAYAAKEKQLRDSGETDEVRIADQAQTAGTEQAVKSAPALAAYMVGGKLASSAVTKLLPASSAIVKGLAGTAAGATANVGVGSATRWFEGEAAMPNLEQLTQDVLWGVVHGVGEYSKATAQAKAAAAAELRKRVGEQTAIELDEVGAPHTADAIRQTVAKDSAPEPPAPKVEPLPSNVPPASEQPAGEQPPVRNEGTPPQSESAPQPPPMTFKLPLRAEAHGDEMVPVKVDAFEASIAEDPGYIPPGGEGIEGRRADVEAFLKTGEPIETPEVHVDETGRASFTDGRHRYAVLRDQGESTVPMAMSPTSAENARQAGLVADEAPSAGPAEAASGETEIPAAAAAGEAATPPLTEKPGNVPLETTISPSADTAGDRDATSIRNAIVDEERVKRGLPPLMSEARKSFGTTWDEAMKRVEADPEAPRNLLDELEKKPRPLTDVEDALLLHRKVTLQNEYDRASGDAVKAHEAGDTALAEEHRLRSAFLSDELNRMDEVGRKVGTEQGRGLAARRLMAKSDYSLAAMVTRRRAANGGKPLSPEAQAEVDQQHAAIESAQKAEEAAVAKADEAASTAVASDLLTKAVEKIKPTLPKSKTVPKAKSEVPAPSPRTVSWIEKQAEAARARIAARRKQTFADPLGVMTTLDLADRVIVGAADIASGLRDFAGWAAKQVSELGDAIKPHLEDLWHRSNALLAQHDSVAVIADRMAARAKDGATLKELRPYVIRMAEGLVRNGVTELDPLLDALHPLVEDVFPDTSRRQVMDVFSGYGEFKALSKDQIAVQLRELRGEAQQTAKIGDMLAGEAPKRTGMERRTPSEKERKLIQTVNELKKKGGFQVTDPETQLKSALQAQERALSNAIRDIATEIETGERRQASGTSPTNDRIENMKALLARLRQTREQVFGSRTRELTDEQRLKLAIDAANRSAEEYERQVHEEDFARKKGKPTLTNAQLEAAKARRDAAKAERDELRELDSTFIESRAAKREQALVAQIAELDRRLKDGDLSSPGKARTGEPSNAAEALASERDAMRRQLDQMRRDANRKTPDQVERQKIEKLQKSIAELDIKLRNGDYSTKARNGSTDSTQVEALKSERAAMQKYLAEVRREASKAVLTDAEKEAAAQRRALAAYKARTAKRIAELTDKLAREDFSPPPPRRVLKLDTDALKAKADLERAKLEYERSLIKDRLAKRDLWEKTMEGAAKWRRAFVLSGVHTLAKLASAATEIVGFAPIEEAVGGVIGKLPGVRQVAQRAPRHGGFSVQAEAEAIAANFTNLFRDVGDYMSKGGLDLDAVYGKPHLYPFELKELVGRVHGALKTPARRNEWTRSFRKRMIFEAKKGVDITDPLVQTKIGLEAYKDADKSIFMESNMVVDAYKRALSRFAQVDKTTGKPSVAGKATETAAKFFLPVIRIPTNIVARIFEYTCGTVTGSARLASAFRKGIENLPPEHADLIMQNLKRGSLGAAVMLIGFFNPQNVGGFYNGKRDEEDVKAGELRVFGTDVPKVLIHNPLLEQLQIGATIRRVMESKLHKRDKETQGLDAGVWAAAAGLVKEVPFTSLAVRLVRALEPSQRGEFLGELAKSAVPQGVQELAKATDKDPQTGEPVKRKPTTPIEHLETALPGLRDNVPEQVSHRR